MSNEDNPDDATAKDLLNNLLTKNDSESDAPTTKDLLNDILSENASNGAPANDVPTKDVSNGAPANDVPTKDVSNGAPANDVPTKDVSNGAPETEDSLDGSSSNSGNDTDDDEINSNDDSNNGNDATIQDDGAQGQRPEIILDADSFVDSAEPSKAKTESMAQLLRLEKLKSSQLEEKLKHALADYQNLRRKTLADVENGINTKINEFALDFLKIHDDFTRAKKVFIGNQVTTEGLDSILKNMDSILNKYNIRPVDALGEIFDPHLHEAISVTANPDLDDNTIIQELRKGYTSNGIVIRPTLVEITKKE